MKSLTTAYKAHIAGETTTLAICCLLKRRDGTSVRLTDHDSDIIVATWTGADARFNGTYLSALGFLASTVETTETLAVDNLELNGIEGVPSITEADVNAAVWDFAAIDVIRVNYLDLTQKYDSLRRGWGGQLSLTERGSFVVEANGLTQAYTRTIGELTQPGCRAELYDSRCKVDPTAFTVTGTLTDVGVGGFTLYDTARTEPGPAGGIAIIDVSRADPGVFSVADVSSLSAGEPVMISGVAGTSSDWQQLNTQAVIRSIDKTHNQFTTAANTSAFLTAYTASSGTVTPLGGDSGYFDFGLITMTSGLNNGLSQEVRSYVPGQWTLELPFPYALAIGDTYSMRAGCDKALSTCKTKFANVVNLRGEPYLPGFDKMIQVGKQ